MKQSFSTSWNSSVQPRKQRKYQANAPLHTRQKFVHVHLSEALRKKYGKRSVGIKQGDKVRILVGQFKGTSGKVEKVSLKDSTVIVTGVDTPKKDGSKSPYPIHTSNIVVEELNLDDKKRKEKLAKNDKKSS
ncbi:50S ribosomal protein L24 [Candidatus Woesearchaeota archaeon]|nr:50S ribosomal protein L24 [Candidatus Woesearchaeota archaeon]